MTKTFEWHCYASLGRRLRGLLPRTSLVRMIATRKIKTYGQRGTRFAFDPDDLQAIEIQETARRIRLAAEALPPSDPGRMTDAQLGDAYASANSEGQSSLWMEISRRRERGGQETMRQISDAMQRRAGKLQPMIDKFVGVYWNPETKQTTKTQGKTK